VAGKALLVAQALIRVSVYWQFDFNAQKVRVRVIEAHLNQSRIHPNK
jgi:hypothetical protein